MEEDVQFEFDKFMNDIVQKEVPSQKKEAETTPQREYIRRYRELPQNRINWEG